MDKKSAWLGESRNWYCFRLQRRFRGLPFSFGVRIRNAILEQDEEMPDMIETSEDHTSNTPDYEFFKQHVCFFFDFFSRRSGLVWTDSPSHKLGIGH